MGRGHKGEDPDEVDQSDRPSVMVRLYRQSREPGSMLNAMLPTYTGGIALCAAVWAPLLPLPFCIALGAAAVVLAFLTIRLFSNGS